jgi:hypothetical protein
VTHLRGLPRPQAAALPHSRGKRWAPTSPSRVDENDIKLPKSRTIRARQRDAIDAASSRICWRGQALRLRDIGYKGEVVSN